MAAILRDSVVVVVVVVVVRTRPRAIPLAMITMRKFIDGFPKARFIRRISAVSNAIETIDNEMICLIIFCLNCIRHGRNATYEPGLRFLYTGCLWGSAWRRAAGAPLLVKRATI